MSEELYQRLRRSVAEHSAYFQATPTGVEIKILKRLFDDEEAELYLHLTENLETPQRIAERAMQDPETVAALLRRMATKGLVFPKHKDDTYYYAAPPFAHGILEHQVNRLDRELAQDYEDYIWAEKLPEESAEEEPMEITLPLRSIPVKAPVNISRPVAPYEDVKALIKNQDRIGLTRCFCALQQRELEAGCHQPIEVCFLLGFYAEYYIEQGWARRVSQEEALKILEEAEEAGLVHQIPDTQDPGAICNCCPNCCGQLRILKMLPNPAALIPTNYYCRVDADLCNGCETCVDRCSMEAIHVTSEAVVRIEPDRCIGCGLCINACADRALTLVSKPEEERGEPAFTSRFMRSSQDIEGSCP